MEERRYSGEQILTPNASASDLARALQDERNRMVALHRPGSMITKDDGSRWIVQFDGSLRPARAEES